MSADVVCTGIRELDEMLGGGMPRSGVVLVRGGPGSGKTTLCLQVLHNILLNCEDSVGLFVSLEVPPNKALDHMKRAYGRDFGKIIKNRFAVMDCNALTRKAATGSMRVSKFVNALRDQRLWKLNPRQKIPKLVLVDSLTVLVNCFRGRTGTVDDMRTILHDLSRVVAANFADHTMIFTGEYDPSNPRATSLLGESFFSDAEIVLSSEAVPVHERTDESLKAPAEERFFCKVLKAREQPRQLRRCSYDFVTNKGIVFYETFPGDGRVVLFEENLPMRQEWRIFRTRDIRDLYPCLEFDAFDRSGLQRTFASQRRLQSVPERTNMTLHSFDTYWINWYAELCQRSDIVSALKGKELPCVPLSSRQKHERFSVLVGGVHRFCNDCVKHLNEALSTLGTEAREHPEASLSDVLEAVIGRGKTQFAFGADNKVVLLQRNGNELASVSAQSFYSVFIRDEQNDLLIDVQALVRALSWNRDYVLQKAAKICKAVDGICGKCNTGGQQCADNLTELLVQSAAGGESRGLLQSFDGGGLLEIIDCTQLRLFGGRRSQIIDCLNDYASREGRPIFRLFRTPGSRQLIAVPYHANVGLLTVNSGVLKEIVKDKSEKELADGIKEEYNRLKGMDNNSKVEDPVQEAATHLAEQLKADRNPQTWEEVMALCRLFQARTGRECCLPLLLETRTTFDTYMATFLEVLWSTGAILDIRPDYTYEDNTELLQPNGTLKKVPLQESLLWTFRLFRNLFASGFTPSDSSLEVDHVRTRFDQINRQVGEEGSQTAGRWLFARHWYSTLVDMLTARTDPQKENGDFMINPEDLGGRIDMTPVPLALDEYVRQWRVDEIPLGKFVAKHHPCWGEWYLTVLKGSENQALAVDLINNLMSSQKIAERAFMCAGVPTVADFYEMYSDVRCINIPDRPDRDLLPQQSWREFRDKFMKGAMSRTVVFDYRHCIRELHVVLELVRNTATTTAAGSVPSSNSLKTAIEAALKRIEELAKKRILVD